MTTFLATCAVLILVVGAMAVGVMIQGRRLRGSCGLTGEDCACSALRARSCRFVNAVDDGTRGSEPQSARTGSSSSPRKT